MLRRHDIDRSELLSKVKFNVPFKSTRFNPLLAAPKTSKNYRQNNCIVC